MSGYHQKFSIGNKYILCEIIVQVLTANVISVMLDFLKYLEAFVEYLRQTWVLQ